MHLPFIGEIALVSGRTWVKQNPLLAIIPPQPNPWETNNGANNPGLSPFSMQVSSLTIHMNYLLDPSRPPLPANPESSRVRELQLTFPSTNFLALSYWPLTDQYGPFSTIAHRHMSLSHHQPQLQLRNICVSHNIGF